MATFDPAIKRDLAAMEAAREKFRPLDGVAGAHTPTAPGQSGSGPRVINVGFDAGGDIVAVPGYGRMPFSAWLAVTDAAIAAGPRADWVMPWMRASGFTCYADIQAYRERRRLFDQPGDEPLLTRCRKCGAVLTNPISKAIGAGPVCRGSR